MRVITTVTEMHEEARALIQRDAAVGFVPTMGALHAGHLSLIERSVQENEVTVVSIFVNPTQFNEESDLESYPRTMEEDLEACQQLGVNLVFAPEADEMYSPRRDTVVMVNELANHLCGLSRGRAHFIGVCTVVTKLFNIVQPDTAYFGQKDAQQALIIQRMAQDLSMPVRIKVCPIVREEDGLAMSSRNVRIPQERRSSALCLYKGLCRGREAIRQGESDASAVATCIMETILEDTSVELDYLHIVSTETLEDVSSIEDIVLIAGAIRLGEIRLIDNILVGPDGPWDDNL